MKELRCATTQWVSEWRVLISERNTDEEKKINGPTSTSIWMPAHPTICLPTYLPTRAIHLNTRAKAIFSQDSLHAELDFLQRTFRQKATANGRLFMLSIHMTKLCYLYRILFQWHSCLLSDPPSITKCYPSTTLTLWVSCQRKSPVSFSLSRTT